MPDVGQKCIIVLGMHRSGTSAITRIVNLLGAEIGNSLNPANHSNPKGFWEHNKILTLHECLLKEIGYFWDDVRFLPNDWWCKPTVKRIQEEILNVLQNDFKDSMLWVLKEPRMCRLLKLWHPIFLELNCQPHFIIIFRHPIEVAASLGKRNKLPLNKSLLFWFKHILESEKETRNYPRIFISFSDFMNDWRSTMKIVSEELRIAWPVSYSKAEGIINDFLDPKLVHHEIFKNIETNETNLPKHINSAYNELLSIKNKSANFSINIFDELFNAYLKDTKGFYATALSEEVQVRSDQLSSLRKNYNDKLAQLSQSNTQLKICEDRLKKIRDSFAWKITTPIRNIYNIIVARVMSKKNYY